MSLKTYDQLVAENALLREALRPFTSAADYLDHDGPGMHMTDESTFSIRVNMGDCRRARAALAPTQPAPAKGGDDTANDHASDSERSGVAVKTPAGGQLSAGVAPAPPPAAPPHDCYDGVILGPRWDVDHTDVTDCPKCHEPPAAQREGPTLEKIWDAIQKWHAVQPGPESLRAADKLDALLLTALNAAPQPAKECDWSNPEDQPPYPRTAAEFEMQIPQPEREGGEVDLEYEALRGELVEARTALAEKTAELATKAVVQAELDKQVCRMAKEQADTIDSLRAELTRLQAESAALTESHYETVRIGSEVLGRQLHPERTQDVATDLGNEIDSLRETIKRLMRDGHSAADEAGQLHRLVENNSGEWIKLESAKYVVSEAWMAFCSEDWTLPTLRATIEGGLELCDRLQAAAPPEAGVGDKEELGRALAEKLTTPEWPWLGFTLPRAHASALADALVDFIAARKARSEGE